VHGSANILLAEQLEDPNSIGDHPRALVGNPPWRLHNRSWNSWFVWIYHVDDSILFSPTRKHVFATGFWIRNLVHFWFCLRTVAVGITNKLPKMASVSVVTKTLVSSLKKVTEP
jgi:hypothetical protein